MRLHPQSPLLLPSAARNPARHRIDWRVYCRCFPRLRREVLSTVAFALVVSASLPFVPQLWPLLFVVMPLVGPYSRRAHNARRHFETGDVSAAKVLDPESGLVAAFADLGTHPGAFYPTVRLLNYPLAEMAGGPFASGDDVAVVSTFIGALGGHKRDGFNPIPAGCATSDPEELARLRDLVPEWQWMFLNEALFRIPRPYRPGMYPVGELTMANVADDR